MEENFKSRDLLEMIMNNKYGYFEALHLSRFPFNQLYICTIFNFKASQNGNLNQFCTKHIFYVLLSIWNTFNVKSIFLIFDGRNNSLIVSFNIFVICQYPQNTNLFN